MRLPNGPTPRKLEWLVTWSQARLKDYGHPTTIRIVSKKQANNIATQLYKLINDGQIQQEI